MTSFYLSNRRFAKQRGGLYAGRFPAYELVGKNMTHLGLGNPFVKAPHQKREATLELVESILSGEGPGREWFGRAWRLHPNLLEKKEREIVCHCEGHVGCHGHLVAALFNTKHDPESWMLTVVRHRDKIGAENLVLF